MRTAICLCLAIIFAGISVAQEVTAHPGDGLSVTVLGEKELSGRVAVRDDGTITLPLAGSVKVAGQTTAVIARLITERLAEYVKNPQVTVEMVERASIKVTVSGAVRSPGVYFVARDSRVADALAVAGGTIPAADPSRLSLIRGSRSEMYDYRRFLAAGDMSQNPVLDTGDNVLIAERIPEVDGVRVQGMVVKPGAFLLREGMTPWDAISEAGGLSPGANPRQALLRSRAGDTQTMDLTILLGPQAVASAPVLRPGDSLIIPGFSTQVFILGGVNRPGAYYVQEGTRVLEAIGQAGGVSDFAVLDQAKLLRAAGGPGGKSSVQVPVNLRKLLEGDLALNLQMQAGDTLSIPINNPAARPRGVLEKIAPYLGPLMYLVF